MADTVNYDRKTIKFWFIAISVGLWWTANSITAITSKSFMRDRQEVQAGSWSFAFADFRWLELTALQHLIGAVVSVIWLNVFVKKPVWPSEASKKIISLAALGNVLGNMATNAAYALVSSSMTQVLKACEPLFTFSLSLFLYRDYRVLNATTLLSIVIMITGASLFVTFDATFIVSGLLAALCSSVGFPVRNIYLKKLSDVWQSSFQKYAVISLYSVFLLSPAVVVKLIIFNSSSLFYNLQDGLISSLFHCTYNLASINVLQNFTPLTHAILNLLKRGIVIVINVVYLQLPLSWKMIIGLVAVLAGLYIYLNRNVKGEKFSPPSAVLVVVIVILVSLFFVPMSMVAKTRTTIGIRSSTFHIADTNYSAHNANSYSAPNFNVREDIEDVVRKEVFVASNFTRSAWVYDRPVSKLILLNLMNLAKVTPIHVHCGTSHCIKAIQELSSTSITAEFLLIGELVKGTPFEGWLSRHSFYKVLALKSYEDHLQKVVRLSILWKYGGLYIEPNVQIFGRFNRSSLSCSSKTWVGQHSNDTPQNFRIACFPQFSTYIQELSRILVKEYYKSSSNYSKRPTFDVTKEILKNHFHLNQLPEIIQISFQTLPTESISSQNQHYGTLSFDTRVSDVSDTNIGDEIQGYPGLQFLPFLDNFLDRDYLSTNKNNDQHILAFFNAWWGGYARTWPPQFNVEPLFLAVHIGSSMKWNWEKHISYVKARAPIGCRDYGTQEFLANLGVPGFFSGCLTLMQHSPSIKAEKTDEIIITDVNDRYFDMLPQRIKEKGIRITHNFLGEGRSNNIGRFTEAFKMIERYSKAKLVITQRIHSALPCVAMGTPVIFINSALMPGGGGTAISSSARTVGLTSMFHTLDLYKMSEDDVPKWFANFSWDNPPPNPDMATMMRLRAAIWYVIRQRPSLYDAGRKFGIIPMSPPVPCTSHVLFHIHFTSPDDHFTWQDHRSIESIFRQHPCAIVHVYSNTLKGNRFDVFTESGYMISIVRYKFRDLLKDTPLEAYVPGTLKRIPASNEKYLLRSLVVYKEGGVYMDSNIILTKSVDQLTSDLLVWGDSSKENVDTSFFRFNKGSKYLESVLTKFASKSGTIDNGLYTRVLQELKGQSGFSVVIHDYGTVFVFDTMQVDKQCYEHVSSSTHDSIKQSLQEKAIAVALSKNYSITKTIGNTALKPETICKDLLHNFCVICSKLL